MDKKRFFAWIIDFIIVAMLQAFFTILFIILRVLNIIEIMDIYNYILAHLVLTYCSVFLFVIRDILGKKSLGKKILKLKIVDKDGNEANFIKRLLRNITLLLLPIEIIVFLITNKRIGDKIAGTDVIVM